VKRKWIDQEHSILSMARQCELLDLPRSTWYYRPAGESAKNLALMRKFDVQYTKTPFYGSRKMAKVFAVNRKRVRRLMRLMGIEAVHPKRRTTRAAPGDKIYPYLQVKTGMFGSFGVINNSQHYIGNIPTIFPIS